MGSGQLSMYCMYVLYCMYSIYERLAYKKGLQKLGTDRQIRRQGRAFEHYFGPRGGNLNDPIFKSSNARGLPGGKGY